MDRHQLSLGRFSEPALLILSCLQSSPKQGQAIREEMRQTHGLWLEPGTLWGTLSRLEARGWIEPLEPQERGGFYRVTVEGTKVLDHASTFLQERIAFSDLEEQGQQIRARLSPFLRKSSVMLGKGLLRLYPRPWRRRYAAEMESALEQQPITFLTLPDLLRGALDAQIHPHMNTEHVSLARRRSAAISYMCVFPLFLLFLLFLVLRDTASPFYPHGPGSPRGAVYYFIMPNNFVMQASGDLIGWSALVDGVAFLVSGLLLAGWHMRSAFVARRRRVWFLASLPFLVELLALVGLGMLLVLLFRAQNGDDGPGSVFLALTLLGVILLGAVTSLVLGFVEVFRKKMAGRIVLVALIPATVGTVAMAGAWVVYFIWGITIWSSISEYVQSYSLFSPAFEDWQKAWEMNLVLLTLPTAFVLWRLFLALFATGKALKGQARMSLLDAKQ